MPKWSNVILLSLPALTLGAASALAAARPPAAAPAGVLAPAPAAAAVMPAGCGGCAGHDCANCPLMGAAKPARETAAAAVKCGTD